jgi:excinuclease UvrABC nuclease subunit
MEWITIEDSNEDIGYFIYVFMSKENRPIYVGKTKQKLSIRMSTHNHLPNDCYNNVDKIYFGKVESEADMAIYEAYYINKYKPRYNTMLKYGDKLNIKLPDLDFKLLA